MIAVTSIIDQLDFELTKAWAVFESIFKPKRPFCNGTVVYHCKYHVSTVRVIIVSYNSISSIKGAEMPFSFISTNKLQTFEWNID